MKYIKTFEEFINETYINIYEALRITNDKEFEKATGIRAKLYAEYGKIRNTLEAKYGADNIPEDLKKGTDDYNKFYDAWDTYSKIRDEIDSIKYKTSARKEEDFIDELKDFKEMANYPSPNVVKYYKGVLAKNNIIIKELNDKIKQAKDKIKAQQDKERKSGKDGTSNKIENAQQDISLYIAILKLDKQNILSILNDMDDDSHS